MRIANFMDSSLHDLARKGVLDGAAEIYNPGGQFERVVHFTPHAADLTLQRLFSPYRIELVHHPASGVSVRQCTRALWRVVRVLRQENIDLVRGRLPYLGSLIGALAARVCGLPFVVSLGGNNRLPQERNGSYYYGHRWLSYGMERLVMRMASAIIVPNEFSRHYVGEVAGARCMQRCVTVPWLSPPLSAVDDGDDALLQALDLPAGRPLVCIVGFVNRYKFSDVLFDALQGVGDAGVPDALYCFAGDGPLRDAGERRFADAAHVRFLGWQPQRMVQALLRRAQVVLVPMSGFVLLEAASLGKPVVTSNLEWHPEIVTDGVSGLLVEPGDPGAWRRALAHMLCAPARAEALGAALRQRYEADYALPTAVARERALYERLLRREAVR